MGRRVLMLGLDCGSPELFFDRWSDQLPVVSQLRASATYGSLHSVHPPITVPAWISMLTGRDPGELGIYGFRRRRDRRYSRSVFHDSSSVRFPTIWDRVGESGDPSIVIGFPLGYPVSPIRGVMISGMLTPPDASSFTCPSGLAADVRRWAPGYRFDTDAHRKGDLTRLVDEVFEMTRSRFRVARELLRREPWRFAFVHEIGLDRLQHALWDALDDPGSTGYETLLEYHKLLDSEIGETLDAVPNDTVILLASDHGARKLEGSFAINEWLRQQGLLAIDGPLQPNEPFDLNWVDWKRTRAWADGGYCGRIYLNVEGREPEGVVPAAEYYDLRGELRERLEQLPGPDGAPLGSAVYTPEEVYSRCEGIPPDLLFYPGDLRWRCAATVGHADPYLVGNDLFHDTANHAWEGLFLLHDPESPGTGRRDGAHLLDVAPCILERLGLPLSASVCGSPPRLAL
ncbi:MAG: alkaline phosphatase family protein [Myxococcota bacterium]